MLDVATLLGLLALAAATGLSIAQWRAEPTAGRGFLGKAAGAATKVVTSPSTRVTVALAVAAGMIGAQWGAARLVEGTAWLAGVTGLDAAAWAPAGADVVAVAVLAVCVVDVVVIGLCGADPAWLKKLLRKLRLPPLLDPALRHTIFGLALFPVLVAAVPLLWQTGSDAVGAAGGAQPPAACAPADLPEGKVAGFGPDRLANAAVIVQVGKDMHVPERGQWVALATAMQESGLRNLDYGDRDSLGLFQQRPSQGWGTRAQVTDPAYAARSFYTHLLALDDGWKRRPLWQVAQGVQKSGFPTAYSKWEDAAAQVLGAVRGTTCTTETRS